MMVTYQIFISIFGVFEAIIVIANLVYDNTKALFGYSKYMQA